MNNIVYVAKHALTWTVSRHIHRDWELIYCTSGSGEMIFEDRTLRYCANDVTLVPPLLPHENRSEEGFTNIHMNLSEAAIPGTEPFVIRADSNGFLLDAFRAAFYYYSETTTGRNLLPIYGQLISAFITTNKPMHSGVVQQVEDHILQHYPDSSYDLNALLSEFPFNTEYLKKMFKKETGLTPLQYLTNKRLEMAANSLSTYLVENRNVSETARMCGFADPLYFSRLFKKKYGVSPSHYESAPPEAPEDVKIIL